MTEETVVAELPYHELGNPDRNRGDFIAEGLSRLEVSEEALADLLGKSREEFVVSLDAERFSTALPVRLVRRDRETAVFEAFDEPERAGEPRELASGGIISFSRVGFSADGREAVLIERFYCGPRCGEITAIRLILDGTGWQIEESELVMTF